MKTKPDTQIVGIGTLIKGGGLFVPAYQRNYDWRTVEVSELFDDYAKAIDRPGDIHFLGAIVLRQSKHGLEVVDGQQRLATTTLILAAIRDIFYARKDDTQVDTTTRDYLYRIDGITEAEGSNIRLNLRNQEFFMRAILRKPNEPARASSRDEPVDSSNIKLKDAAEEIRAKFNTLLKATPEAAHKTYLKEWKSFIESRATVLTMQVEDSENAYFLFETQNDRGARVSEADLVKTYVFRLIDEAGDKTRLEHAIYKWNSIVAVVESLGANEDFIDFLRIAFTVKYGLTKRRELFKNLKSQIEVASSAERLVHELQEFAESYVAMLSPDHQKWNNYPPSIRRSLRTLARFDVMQIRYVMLAVAQKFNEIEAAKAFRLFVNWIVRFFIAGSDKIGRVDKRYASISNMIYAGNLTTAAGIAKEMLPDLADNDSFRDAFKIARVTQRKLARYYLDSLERQETQAEEAGLVPDDDTTRVNLEHILPQHPNEQWSHISDEEAELLYNRIGNMALLNARKNAKIGNVGFSEKCSAFKSSPFLLTNRIADLTKWDAEEIDKRQSYMADLAVKTWPLTP